MPGIVAIQGGGRLNACDLPVSGGFFLITEAQEVDVVLARFYSPELSGKIFYVYARPSIDMGGKFFAEDRDVQ
jgi:hypothetical protein